MFSLVVEDAHCNLFVVSDKRLYFLALSNFLKKQVLNFLILKLQDPCGVSDIFYDKILYRWMIS